MWSEEIDKKIRESADGYKPPRDEMGWDKMELLLNKHLPPEKRKRRFVWFWLIPMALIGTGIFVVLQNKAPRHRPTLEARTATPETKNTGEAKAETANTEKTVPASQRKTVETATKTGITETKNNSNSIPVAKSTAAAPGSEVLVPAPAKPFKTKTGSFKATVAQNKLPGNLPVRQTNRKLSDEVVVNDKTTEKTSGADEKISAVIPPATGDNIDQSIVTNPESDTSAVARNETTVTDSKMEDPVTTDSLDKPEKTSRPSGSFLNRVNILVSAGPDISSVGLNRFGKWEFQYGLGIGYEITKRLTIRAGFYTGHKVYTADSSDYKAAYLPPKLEKIEANCTVFEIPLNLIYSFATVKKHNWFIAGGLSSYLMKKEVYDYYYENAWGQLQVYSRTYKSESNHLFSVINLSGGYRYNFSDRVFFMAEPYVRLPLGGVGHGKVKLNSGGVLFSAGFRPFR